MQLANFPSILHPDYPGPQWWNTHGDTMAIARSDPGVVFLSNSAAHLKIERWGGNDWLLAYEIRQSLNERYGGQVVFTTTDLQYAFGLRTGLLGSEPLLVEMRVRRYGGADTFKQGLFIRLGRCLNIPGPGTGHDGDPNLSIEVTEEIREAVYRLMNG